MRKLRLLLALILLTLMTMLAGTQSFAAEKPNILVIWGDDIGTHNINPAIK